MKNNLCTVRTSYSFYKETAENPLSIKEYTSIVYGFFKFLLKDLFLAREVKIPCKLGSFQIIGKKKKPTIGEDGTVYVLSCPPQCGLYALNPDGSEKWLYPLQNAVYNSPAIDADGTILLQHSDIYLLMNLVLE